MKTSLKKFEDTKGVIRSCKSKDRQHKGQKKKDKEGTNPTQNSKDRAARTSLKTVMKPGAALVQKGQHFLLHL